MRRTMLITASVVLLACLGACTDDRSDGASDEVVVAAPTASVEPAALDPFAWTDVSYEDYLAAADELGLRRDVLLPMAGFSSGLNALCHSSAKELADMRSAQMEHTKDTETYSTARYLGDEVALRLGLACPQRMTDWNAAGIERDDSESGDSDADDGVSAVSDAELAEAIAEEASSDPAYEHGDSDSDSDSDSGHDSSDDSSHESDDESDDEVSTTSSGGVTTGNGSKRY